jgi:hypothetical protein
MIRMAASLDSPMSERLFARSERRLLQLGNDAF